VKKVKNNVILIQHIQSFLQGTDRIKLVSVKLYSTFR